jgi:hypothetical protein
MIVSADMLIDTVDGRVPNLSEKFISAIESLVWSLGPRQDRATWSIYNREMKIPEDLPVYREPFSGCPSIQTYTSHINALCQLQWDYVVDWPDGERPKIWICAYRCFQRTESSAEFRQVDQVPFDVPVWEELIRDIAQHAAEILYASAQIVGPIVQVSANYRHGAEEASNKRYDMGKYREMNRPVG